MKEYFGSKGWLTRYAQAEDSRGMWQKYVDEVESNKVPDPSSMKLAKYIPRHEWDNMNTPDLEQTPDSVLRPGETLEDFDVTFRRPNADGGVQQLVQNTVDGSRPGYDGNPGAQKVFNKALDSFYNEFDKEVVDAASIQDHGVTFDKLKGEDKRRSFKKYFKQDMKDYGEYIGTKNPDKDRRTMKRGIIATKEADIKIKLIDATKKGDFFKPEKFAKDNKITLEQLKAEAKQLQRNIYEKRMITAGKKSRSTLVWLSNSDFETDNVLEKISKSGLVNRKDNRTNTIFFDAFGRKFKKGTIDTPNPTYNFEKYKAIRKNVNEFGAIKKLISKKYPNLNFDLDHGLSKQTINKLFNGTAEELSRVNIMDADLNRGFKKSLSEKYFKALGYNANGKQIGKVNLEAKKAVEKIAKDLNINIGNVSDDLKTFDRGVQSFEKLNIREELIKSLKNQKDLNLNFKTFVNENPKLLTTAGFDITKIGPKLTKVTDKHIAGVTKIIRDAGIPCIKGVGGNCTTPEDFRKGFNQLVKEAADGKGSKQAISKLTNFTKSMRKLKGAATWTGYGLLAEAGFMVPFAVGDYASGKSWKRIAGNATDYGFGPIFGQSEQEEFEAALPEGSKAVEGEKAIELSEQLQKLDEQKFRPQGRIGMDQARKEKSRENVITGITDEFKLNLDPFLSDTPFAKDQWHQGMWNQAHQDAADARAQIAKENLERLQKRRDTGTIAQEDWMVGGDTRGYATGGLAGLMKKYYD